MRFSAVWVSLGQIESLSSIIFRDCPFPSPARVLEISICDCAMRVLCCCVGSFGVFTLLEGASRPGGRVWQNFSACRYSGECPSKRHRHAPPPGQLALSICLCAQMLHRVRSPSYVSVTMPADEFTDDYVANLLKQDAKSSSARYAAVGLEAFLPRRYSCVFFRLEYGCFANVME